MADPWELILDHPYTGTPGVVFDHTPGQDSHGGGVNLADGDFLSDGASPGSGAVNFQPDSMIRVPATKSGAQRFSGFQALGGRLRAAEHPCSRFRLQGW